MTKAKAMLAGLKTFLKRKAGPVRDGESEELKLVQQRLTESNQKLEKTQKRLEDKDQKLAELKKKLLAREASTEVGGVRPENLIWIIGAPRTGSTWLSHMLGDLGGCGVWQEPFFGVILSLRDNIANQGRVASPNFVLGEPNKPIWLEHMRRLFLAVGQARFSGYSHLVVKEPNGSLGSRLILEAFPESSAVLLVRDPRDVVASLLDLAKPGGWYNYDRYEISAATAQFDAETGSFTFPQPLTAEEQIGHLSRDVAASFEASREAFDAHDGRKVLIKYEDLRTNTLGTMRELCSALELAADEDQLTQAVEKHSWKNIPEDKKGQGKPRRKATPGSWKEDLTPEQVKVVERITAPLLMEFYPE